MLFRSNNIVECTTATGGRRFIIEASGLKGNEFIPPITVKTIRTTGEVNNLAPNHARLLVEQTETGEIESVTLHMTDVIVGAGQVGENQRGELVVPNLHIQNITLGDQIASTIPALLAVADAMDSNEVTRSAKSLRLRLENMENQILARIAQRWAVSFLPLVVVLLGSLLAIRFSDRVPLVVYSKVFVPSVFALLFIFAGGQMLRDGKEFTGFFVMWIGNFGVTCLVLFHWLKLRLV